MGAALRAPADPCRPRRDCRVQPGDHSPWCEPCELCVCISSDWIHTLIESVRWLKRRKCWSRGLFILPSRCYQRSVLATVEEEADRGKALLTCLLRQIKSSICISCAPMKKDLSSAQWEREGWGRKIKGGPERKGETCFSVFFIPSLRHCLFFKQAGNWHKGAIVKYLYLLLTLFQPWPGFSSPRALHWTLIKMARAKG